MKNVLFILLLFSSCISKQREGKIESASSRIKVYEEDVLHCTYKIIEVDSHLYLNPNQGGIVHMESCYCKRNEKP
jgi:hypothetical protein